VSARGGAHPDEPSSVEVPVSAGIPTGVRISFLASIVLAVAMLALVVAVSAINHVWPAGDSLHVRL
jgi:hypothetical protein